MLLLCFGVGLLALILRPPVGPEDGGRRIRWAEVAVEPPPGPLASLLEEGGPLFGWQCLPCHGPEGRGDGPVAERLGLRARDFSRGLFQLKTSLQGEPPFDDDLFRTITAGIPASGMPPFPGLSARERWALVAMVKSLAPVESAAARSRITVPPTRGDAARGARLYGPACAPCHGSDGGGKGPASAGLDLPPPDLSRGELTFKGGSSQADLFRILTTGLAGSPMPSFAGFTERERADLAAFVTTLYRPVPRGELLFLTAGCMSCHTLGKGRLIGPDLLGVTRRRDRRWLRRWLADPQELIATDEEARRLARVYGSPMPDPDLSDAEIEQVLDYLDTRR